MTKINTFISFDFENDQDLRDLLWAQDKQPEASFQMTDCSVEELLTDGWREKIRERIRRVDQVIFICGERTHRAQGVGVEYAVTRQQGKPYFFLQGRPNKSSSRPRRATDSDKIYMWTLDNLQALLAGKR